MTAASRLILQGIRPLRSIGAAARNIALSHTLGRAAFSGKIPSALQVIPPDPWPGDAQRGRDLIAGVFDFAGQMFEKDQVSWHPIGARNEWLAELHGFSWLRDLRSAGSERARRMAREMVGHWLQNHQKPEDIIWRPDVIGTRLVAWVSFHDFFCASADEEFRKNCFGSMLRQARYLARALPGGLKDLPLMHALKGLAYSGLAFEDGSERLERAFSLILREIKTQILPDGAHASRSPQQTFEFLQCLVDLRAALIAARLELPAEVQHAIDRITPVVKFFRHADGALAQFNGGQEGNAHLIDTIIMQSGARGRAMRALPHCGYERLQMGRASLIMDTGNLIHSRYADRAHASPLSFEYSYGRERVIVNCGASSVPGRWREILRLTAAHSAMVVDDRSCCDFDASGRLSPRSELALKREENEDNISLEGSHLAFIPRFGLNYQRRVSLENLGETVAGEDVLSGTSGTAFTVRFHLHPHIQASPIRNGDEILLRARSGIGWRFSAPGLVPSLEESIYCGQDESPRRTLQIALSGFTSGEDMRLTWTLTREKM